ncbi:MAG: DNA polymerase III subunit alpha [Flammeovirgaceae bacterium]|nr:DNA polymerase III subunit alpha [Flammeovirgaceae bacterium]
MFLTFDTETTGLPKNFRAPVSDSDNWPRLVQLAWQLNDNNGKLISNNSHIIKPTNFSIPFNSEKIHGISTEVAIQKGKEINEVLEEFENDLIKSKYIIGHNINFDINIIGAEHFRKKFKSTIEEKIKIDTAQISKSYCNLKGGFGGGLKMPKLIEMYECLFKEKFSDAHDASYDVNATAKSFFKLVEVGEYQNDDIKNENINYEEPILGNSNFVEKEKKKKSSVDKNEVNISSEYSHLHNHSQYSVLQATSSIENIIKKALKLNMKAVAITDLGNMFGVFKFNKIAQKNNLKPIIGCEFFVSEDRKKRKFTRDNPDKRFNQILIAKDKEGYENLSYLSSLAYTEGLYGQYPRIDKGLIKKYKKNIIALSGNLYGAIPKLILNQGIEAAEEELKWWLDTFEEDFYIELNRHGLEEEDHVNEVLIEFSKKYNVKTIAANDVFYINKEDSTAHDILLCIKQGEFKSTPIGKGRGKRSGFKNDEYYFKSQEEMKNLFSDIPESINNISEVIDKVEVYELERKVVLPKYQVPSEFDKGGEITNKQTEYLRKITLDGAKKKYKKISDELRERIDFEINTIKNTGYPGYFLIVQEITNKAKELGVSVGPGRGSAAGSVVAYCTGITDVDPIKYNLLFERFLNPDRISLPDIDIDFDDEGREKIINYVIEKYGYDQVAQIITYGSMAAKSAIRDAGRVLELPLSETDRIAKMIPERPGISLIDAFKEVPELSEIRKKKSLEAEVLKQAEIIEGSIRNIGTHACGIIITPDKLTNYIPVSRSKDSDLLITQFDNSVIESAGMLKMDFLGLKTLSIINSAIDNIKKNKNIEIDIDNIPLDDDLTYKLFQRGETNGTFQFESDGMQKHLKSLKPDRFEDLIAMNALYRPGPMEYIPNYIARKHGREKIQYDLPEMEEYLSETYGITVYQEQVMLLSQRISDFTKGEADQLRKAMGKKDSKLLELLKPKFFDGGKKNKIEEKQLEKIWSDWQSFAAYAFNKSHSTCYSLIAYKTAYLKANYKAEYMASVLTHNQNNIDKISYFMNECKKQNIKVLGPNINKSENNFVVNESDQILFGLGAIKGTGESAVKYIIEERKKEGKYNNIFDFICRTSSRSVNKKTYEALALAGAFDCFEKEHRRQFIYSRENELSLIENSIIYSNKLQKEKETRQTSLFSGENGSYIKEPIIPEVEPFSELEKLKIEKDILGLYVSGHPLDKYSFEIENICNTNFKKIKNNEVIGKSVLFVAGIVTKVEHKISKNGKPYGNVVIEDFSDSYNFIFFSEDYVKFKNFFEEGWFLFLNGKMKNKWNNPDELEFKVDNISLLSKTREKHVKELHIKLDIENINKNLIDELNKNFDSAKGGNCHLKVTVLSRNNGKNISVDMISRDIKFHLNDDIIKTLNSRSELGFLINK